MRKCLILALFTGFVLTSHAQNMATIDSLQQVLPQTADTSRVKTLLLLCWEWRFQNADTARTYGTEALELARKLKHKALIAEGLHYLGITHQAQGNYAEALDLETKALALRYELGNDRKTGTTLNNIGIIYDEKGDYKTALEYYFKALTIFQKLQDPEKTALVLTNIGIVQKGLGDYRKAIAFYRESLPLYERIGEKFGLAANHANLGSVYLHIPNFDSALYYSELAYKEFSDLKLTQFEPLALSNAGIALRGLGRNREALEKITFALGQYRVYDNKKEMAANLITLAEIQLDEKNFAQAEASALEGLEVARKIEALDQVRSGSLALSKIYAASGNYKQAYEAYQQYVAAKDTLFQQDKMREILSLQATYERDKKVALLEKQNELTDSRLNLAITMVISLAVVIVLGVVLITLWRNRLKLKQRIELETTRAAMKLSQLGAVIASQEEERRRFAADLHDGMGQFISAMRLSISSGQTATPYLESILQQMSVEIREIAFNLMPQVLMRHSLGEALHEFANRITQSGKTRVEVIDTGQIPVTGQTSVALYRVCQEWVNNVLKYNSATRISIQLTCDAEELTLTIEDNGVGFDRQLLEKGKGNGWKNLNSRIDLLQGTLDLDTQPGKSGSVLAIVVPRHHLQQETLAA